MKRFLISIMMLLLGGFIQPSFATQLPLEVKNYILQQEPETTVRFDGLITLKDGTFYLPLFPAYEVKDATFGIKYTYPENKSFNKKPELIIFSNNFCLLKLIKTKEGLTVTSLKDLPVEVRTGLLPQDLLVPKGLVLPDSLVGILGDLNIPLTSNLKITSKQQIPQTFANAEELPTTPKKIKVIPQLEDKQFFITNFNSNYIYIMPSDLRDVQYTLKLDSIPKAVKEIAQKYLLVATNGKTYIDVVDIKNEEIAKQIDLGVTPDEIIITSDETLAYIVSNENPYLFVIDIPTMNLVKQIQIKGNPEKIAFSDDETKIIYQDAKTNDIYSVELKNNYVNIYQSNIANVSKLALINNNLYVLARTKNAFRIFPYQEFVEEKTVNNAKVFGSSKTYYVKSAIWKTGPVAKNIKKQEQEEQKQKEIESMTNTQEGITIQLSPKPVDMIYQNGKIYVLSAALNSVDIFDIKSNLLEKTIPLKIGGFSTKLNPIKNSNMVIITNVMEKKYALFDLEQQKVLQINPIDVPISTITVVNQTEYETDKKRPSDTTEQIKKQSENL